jgi:hypothetical protein
VFYMAVMAFATVIINGSTTKALLGALGLLQRTPAEVQIVEHVVQVRSAGAAARLQIELAVPALTWGLAACFGGAPGEHLHMIARAAGTKHSPSPGLPLLFAPHTRHFGSHPAPATLVPTPRPPQDLAAIRRETLERLANDPVLGAPLPSAVAAWTRVPAAESAVVTAYRRLGHSRAFVKRAVDVEASASAGVAAEGGLDLKREEGLLVEYRKRVLCAVKAYIGERCAVDLKASLRAAREHLAVNRARYRLLARLAWSPARL